MAEIKLLAQNKKAWHDFFIEETYEAGMALFGPEVKSIRGGKVSIKESYAEIKNGEVFVLGMNVTPYDFEEIAIIKIHSESENSCSTSEKSPNF